MHFFIFFVLAHCVLAFISPVLCFAQPVGVEKSPFLKHMLNEQSVQSSASDKKITNTKKISPEIAEDPVTPKKKLSSPITKVLILLYEGICQCGGKKLWNMTLPKHVRKATIARSLKFLDVLSFITGSVILYAGYCTFLNKQETLLKWYASVVLSLNTFLNRKSTETPKNKPSSDELFDSDFKDNNDVLPSHDKKLYHAVSQTHPALPSKFFDR